MYLILCANSGGHSLKLLCHLGALESANITLEQAA